jgi:Uma2 family endonuclease
VRHVSARWSILMSFAVLTQPELNIAPAGCSIRLGKEIVIPPGITDLESFRRWARSDAFPKRGRFCFFHNELWVDLTMEQAYTHNAVKGEFTAILLSLAKTLETGRYFTDGMRLTHPTVEFSTVPDGLFILFESFDEGRIAEVAGKVQGYVEFEGTPDMVLEVVGDFSEEKDAAFVDLYFQAGILEYWLVDVRQEPVRFDIYKRNARKYIAARRQAGGWLRSLVFKRSFRLVQQTDRRGMPQFALESRE